MVLIFLSTVGGSNRTSSGATVSSGGRCPITPAVRRKRSRIHAVYYYHLIISINGEHRNSSQAHAGPYCILLENDGTHTRSSLVQRTPPPNRRKASPACCSSTGMYDCTLQVVRAHSSSGASTYPCRAVLRAPVCCRWLAHSRSREKRAPIDSLQLRCEQLEGLSERLHHSLFLWVATQQRLVDG